MKRKKGYDAFWGMYARISISGRRCSLTWDENAGDFVLTDLKSAYGTYLANGKRLPSKSAIIFGQATVFIWEKGKICCV